ncbi:GNAT family N-acetyltransferase [Mycoplasmatota bacterium zrk1]
MKNESKVSLVEATHNDLDKILELQKESFRNLLIKYEDYDINPGNEEIGDIIRRFNQSFTEYLLVVFDGEIIGAVRVIKNEEKRIVRISPIFIVPKYQGKGLSQEVFSLIEARYNWVEKFELDTILQEEKLCYLYEKLGYVRTGVYEEVRDDMTIVYYEKMVL